MYSEEELKISNTNFTVQHWQGFQIDLRAGIGIRMLRVGGLSRSGDARTVGELIRKHVPTEKSEI